MNRRKSLCMALVAFLTLSLVTGVTTAHGRNTPDLAESTPFNHDKTPANNSSISIRHEGDSISLDAASNQTVRGNTTLDPGTNLEVQVHATKQFFMSDSVTVQPNGSFNASFNFSEYEPGTEFGVSVGLPRNNSTEIDVLATADGVLQRPGKSTTGSTTTRNTTATTTSTTATTRTDATMASTTSSTTSTNRAINNTTDTDSVTETMANERTASDGQPGFGIVIALFALVGIGLVRRNA